MRGCWQASPARPGQAPIFDGAEEATYLDIDDTVRETHGYAKQAAGYGYSGVKGLNAQLATLSTPSAAPVIAGVRLRRGNVASAHGAARLLKDAVATAKRAGAAGALTVRADSAYYNHRVIAAARAAGARAAASASTPAWASGIPRRSGSPTRPGGSRMPRSPKCPTPRSPPGPRPGRSPPG